jgi:hypothetical protein
MKTIFTFISLLFLIISCNKNASDISQLIREPMLSSQEMYSPTEKSAIQNKFTQTKIAIEKNNQNLKAWVGMMEVYLLQSRVSGDHQYAELINEICTMLLKNKKINAEEKFEILSYQATALLSLHEFAKGLALAKEASSIVPANAAIIGAMIDANVELGNYKEAVMLSDKMINLRPDLRSYSRVSYLRELHGDVDGAVEAMTEAVKSGIPGNEDCEWSRVLLAKLYIQQKKYDYAKMHLTIALENRPGYKPAFDAMTHMYVVMGDGINAKKMLDEFTSLYKKNSFAATTEYANLISDNTAKKQAYMQLLQSIDLHANQLPAQNSKYLVSSKLKQEKIDHTMKQIALEKAKYMIDLNQDANGAMPYLSYEYKIRPNNIEVNKYLAKAYLLLNDINSASIHINKAQSTGWKDNDLMTISAQIKNTITVAK